MFVIFTLGSNISLYGLPVLTNCLPSVSMLPKNTLSFLGVAKFVISFPASNTTSLNSNIVSSYFIINCIPIRSSLVRFVSNTTIPSSLKNVAMSRSYSSASTANENAAVVCSSVPPAVGSNECEKSTSPIKPWAKLNILLSSSGSKYIFLPK